MTARGLAIAFVLGAIGGILCDQIHVQFAVLWYPKPDLLGQSWWVGPLFGFGLIAILLGSKPFADRSIAKEPHTRDLAVGGAIFLLAYLSTGIFQSTALALTIAMTLAWIARVMLRPDKKIALLHALALAFGGVLVESTVSSTGAFQYANPDFGLVPMWLPLLYAHGSPVALDVALRLNGKKASAHLAPKA
jgi:hypothetical protein